MSLNANEFFKRTSNDLKKLKHGDVCTVVENYYPFNRYEKLTFIGAGREYALFTSENNFDKVFLITNFTILA